VNSRESPYALRRKSEYEKKNERFVRWNGYTMAQFGVAIALISALSVSAIGMGLALLERSEFRAVGAHSLCFALSLLLFVAAIVLAFLSTISRLLDFRLTSRVARERLDTRMFGLDKDCFSKLSWGMFWLAAVAFLGGGVLFVLSICTVYLQQFCVHR